MSGAEGTSSCEDEVHGDQNEPEGSDEEGAAPEGPSGYEPL